MGDQTVEWDRFDGMHSGLIGLLNGGMSGFTVGHCDIGGYTAIKVPDIPELSWLRTPELNRRWIEMATFSEPIMRSHPTNKPDDVFQIYDNEQELLFFKKFVQIHARLADYKYALL